MSEIASLIKISDLTWGAVFSLWREEEAHLPHWIEHYRNRGYSSWDEWRKHSLHNLPVEELTWTLFDIEDPLRTIPRFHGGPFRSWIKKYYKQKNMPTFAEIVEHEAIGDNQTINEIVAKFPKESTLVGLQKNDETVIIEGMHRCCAVAVAAKRNLSLEVQLRIALADFNQLEIPIMGEANSPTG